MSKKKKLLLLILSVYPILSCFLFGIGIGIAATLSANSTIPQDTSEIWIVYGSIILLPSPWILLALYIVYIIMLVKDKEMEITVKVVSILFLLIFNMFFLPIFWIIYIKPLKPLNKKGIIL